MSFLSAFLRGAAGQGVLEMGARWDRLDAEARAEARRQEEIKLRSSELAAERERERQFRAEQDALYRRPAVAGGGGSGRGSGGGGGGGGGSAFDVADREWLAAGLVGGKGGAPDLATAKRWTAAMDAGENPLQREEMVPEQIDDGDRMRTVSTQRMVPDTERWMAINARAAKLIQDAPTIGKSNFDQYTQGQGNRRALELTEEGIKAREIGPTQGALVLQGKDPTHPGGTNVATGRYPVGSLDAARAGSEGADAAAAIALRDKRRVEAKGEESPKDRIARQREERLDRQKNIDQLQKERTAAREDGDDARVSELTALIKEKLLAENRPGALPAAAGAKAAFVDSAPEAPRDPAKRRTGQAYRTPKGLMIWRGTGWEAARGTAQ